MTHTLLRQALTALEAVDSGEFYMRGQVWDAITALREALAAPAPEPVAIADGTLNCAAAAIGEEMP